MRVFPAISYVVKLFSDIKAVFGYFWSTLEENEMFRSSLGPAGRPKKLCKMQKYGNFKG